MYQKKLRIATRQSPLALCQANLIKQQLLQHYPGLDISLVPLITSGDKFLNNRLAEIGGKGLFVKELEQAILDDRADFAVHSMKDLPNTLPEALELAIVCQRADHRDVLLSTQYSNLAELPHHATIGTTSLRRQCQLKAIRPDLMVKPLRGNVDSRIKKLHEGHFDAIILAAAGLHRLQLEQHITQYFSINQLLPAVGQGALGLECRKNDEELKQLLQVLSDPITMQCVAAERSLAEMLGGNCQVPLAAYCEADELHQLSLRALIGSPDGAIMLHGHLKGPPDQPQQLGHAVAKILLNQGADVILRDLPHE